MANNSRLATLLVRIAGDADDLERDLEGGMSRAEATVKKAGERISTAAGAIGAGIGAGLAAGLSTAIDNEAAGDKLVAQLGASGQRATELADAQANVYASAWGDSMDDVGTAIRGVEQNIGDLGASATGGLEGMTTKALALAQTFDQDLNVTTAAAGQLMRTGLASSADEAFDIITAGLQSAANKSDDYLETLNEYSTQWRRVGLDAKTATGLLSQGLQAGARDADQVADAIGQFGERALAGGSSVDEAFKSIGLNSQQMATMIGAGGDQAKNALQMTMDALRGTGNEQTKLNAAAALFGDPGNVLGAALFALDPATAAASAGMQNVTGAADRMVEGVSGNPSRALEEFKRTAQQRLAEIASGFVTFAMNNQGVMQPVAIALAVLAGAILTVKVGMTAWSAAQTAWGVATKIATGVQWAFNAAMSANPVSLIIIAVLALVAGIVALYMKSETARDIINGAFSGIWSAIQAVYNWTRDNWPLLLSILTGPIGIAVGQIVAHWDKIKSGALTVINWVRDNWPLVVSLLTGPIGAAVVQIVTHWDKIKSAGAAVLDWFKGLPGALGSALSTVGQIIYAPFKSAFNSVAQAWNNSVGKVGFSVPGWVPKLGGKSWSIPDIPLLAAGGTITGGGAAVVGEAGPELLNLPRGAQVAPLPRGVTSAGGGGGGGRVVIDVTGADDEFKRLIRKMVRVDGRGDVGTAFGSAA
ncbi:phage tail tape measure protein [Frankia sp. AgPm24]|uniref:phage tail tape measure protein n=1 Tax=Frankia sp. AgPm24 TaxID=631128 RepID=UPI00200DCB80|nr:phage tail tape measure protein [Frankia sp. AgPm24]MCK9922458.1 phage tail tape measure protein [Frankia sp. AgPm24]